MKIDGKGRIETTRPSGVAPGAPDSRAVPRETVKPSVTHERRIQDTASFSDEARALSTGSSTRAAASSERVEDAKRRILLGAYNTAEMAGEVARRILQRGDI